MSFLGSSSPRRPLSPPSRSVLALLLAVVPPVATFACGARTALPSPDDGVTTGPGGDAQTDGDARRDAVTRDVQDALPPIDARPRDASRNDCPDADATLVYLITEENELLAFNPAAASFRRIGVIACPNSNGSTPFSMAVDRTGVAYVLFRGNNRLYRVSTLTAACIDTGFAPNQPGFRTFGMGFSSDQGGPAETLFIASDDDAPALGRIDLSTFTVARVGDFSPAAFQAELTGTGDGRLYAFYGAGSGAATAPSFIGEIDKATGQIVGEDTLSAVARGFGWAFAFWGGQFYLFTAPAAGRSNVTRFDPTTKVTTPITSYNGLIVGAGVSTCAPSR